MGVFDFLKKFFGQEEEKETKADAVRTVTEVKLNELDAWIDSYFSDRDVEDKDSEIKIISKDISEEKKKMRENVAKLIDEVIEDPNVSVREKHFMEGNRKAYVQKVNAFLKDVNPPENQEDCLEFCKSFDKALEYFGSGTIRNYQIVSHFFREDAIDISHNLNSIVKLVKKIKDFTQADQTVKMEKLKNSVKEAEESLRKKERIGDDIKTVKDDILKIEKKIKEKEGHIEKIKKSDEFTQFTRLIEKERLFKEERDDVKGEPLRLFSVIGAALKKYERISLLHKLVNKYIENPLKTLLEDKDLEIGDILCKMKEAIIKGEIELKDKKKDKVLNELERIDKDYFEKFIKKYRGLCGEIDKIGLELKDAEVKKKIDCFGDNLKKDNLKLKEEKIKIKKMKKDFDNIDNKNLKNTVEKMIENETDEIVKVL